SGCTQVMTGGAAGTERETRNPRRRGFCYTRLHRRGGSHMANATPKYAWMNGKVIPWDQCVVHGRSAGGFMGANVFEGERAYWNPQEGELFVFKHDEHLQRLARSMKTIRLEPPYTLREIGQGALDLLRANEFRQDAHFVPVAFFGMGAQNFNTLGPTVDDGVY